MLKIQLDKFTTLYNVDKWTLIFKRAWCLNNVTLQHKIIRISLNFILVIIRRSLKVSVTFLQATKCRQSALC